MVRGSTPTFTFKLPMAVSSLKSLDVVFVQNGASVLSFGLERMVFEDNCVSFTLEQEETLLFSAGSSAEVQLKAVTENGEVLMSDIRKTHVRKKYPEDIIK